MTMSFSELLHVRFTDEQSEDLKHIIKVRRTTKSEFVRMAVDKAIEEELSKITQERVIRRKTIKPRRRLSLPPAA